MLSPRLRRARHSGGKRAADAGGPALRGLAD